MPAETLMLEYLLRTAGGGLLFLLAACIAIGLRRQPADRVRAGELALIGSLLIPCVALLPGLAPWSLGLLQTTSAPSHPSIPVESVAAAPPSTETHGADESHAATDPDLARPIELLADQHLPGPLLDTPRRLQADPTAPTPEEPVGQEASAASITWRAVVLTAYACATALVLCWIMLGLGRLFLLRRTARPAPPEAAALLAEIAGPACKRVRLMMSDRIGAPVVFGGFRPVILLPASLCDSGARAALRFCLAHEWSHVERGDLWRWNLAAFAQLVLFYQPLFWWLRRQIRLSQDYLADARAGEQADSIDYAEFLVGLARRQMAAPALALSITDHRSHLTKRVHMLLLNRQPLARCCRTVWTAGVWFTAFALLCLAASIRFAAADPPPQPTSAPPASDEKKDAPAPQAEAKKRAGPKVEGLAVSGQVIDKATGKPISAATVTIAHSPERVMSPIHQIQCRTDAEGKYSVTVPPDQRMFYYEAKAEHPDYAPMYTTGRIQHALGSSAKPFPLTTIELSAGELVTGVVHTPEGKPASGVKVIGYSSAGMQQPDNLGRRLPAKFSSLAQASTDSTGKFSLRMLSSNQAILWIVPEDYAPLSQVLRNKRGDLGTIALQPGVKLRGQLLDGKGKPVPGAYVNMRSTDQIDGNTGGYYAIHFIQRAALTNEKGEFAMQPVPAGKYLVQPKEVPVEIGDVLGSGKKVELPALFVESQVNLKPGVVPEPLEIRAVPHVVVEAQFLDAQGKPMTGPVVSSQILTSRIHGKLDDGTSWNGLFKETPDGKLTAIVLHGLENAELITGAPLQGFAWKKGKNGRLHEPEAIDLSHIRNIPLGTLTEDVVGIEFVQRGEQLKYSGKVVDSSTGKPIEGATVTVRRFILEDPERKEQKRPSALRGSPADVQTNHKSDAEGNYSFFIQPGQSAQRHLYIELNVEHPDYAGKKGLGDALSTIRKKEKAGEPLFFSKIELSPGKPQTPAPKK